MYLQYTPSSKINLYSKITLNLRQFIFFTFLNFGGSDFWLKIS